MANKNETMQMALFCLEIYGAQSPAVLETIEALRTALAQPKPEPVAWFDKKLNGIKWKDNILNSDLYDRQPLYLAPPQRKPFTEEMILVAARALSKKTAEVCNINEEDQWKIYSDDFIADARLVLEAAHNIKGLI